MVSPLPNRYCRRPDGTTGSIPHDIVITFQYDILGNVVDNWVFLADTDYMVTRVAMVNTVQGTGGACTAQIRKASGTTAVASGTAVHSGTLNLVGTNHTLQTATLSTTLTDTKLTLNDRLGFDITGTATSAVGFVQINLKRIQNASQEK